MNLDSHDIGSKSKCSIVVFFYYGEKGVEIINLRVAPGQIDNSVTV